MISGSLFFFLVALCTFGWPFALFLGSRSALGLMSNFALMTFNAVEVIGVIAPQFSAIRAFWRFRVTFLANVTFGAEWNLAICSRSEGFSRHSLIVGVMTKDTIRISVMLLMGEFDLPPFFVNRRDDNIVAW